MAVDYFLIDAPDTVPEEHAAWRAAKDRHTDLFLRFLRADPTVSEQDAIDAKVEADRLYAICRKSWLAKLKAARD